MEKTVESWPEKLPDSGKKPPGKPSARSIWVKSVKKPQEEQSIVSRSPSSRSEVPEAATVGTGDSTVKPQSKPNAVRASPHSIRSVWVVSAKRVEEPIKESQDDHSVACSSPFAEGILVDSGRKSPESPDPDRNQKLILEAQSKKSVRVEFDEKSAVKSQSKKSVVTSSPLVRSVWVVSDKRSPRTANNSEPIKDSQKEHSITCSLPFAEEGLVDTVGKSPDTDRNQQPILESPDEESLIKSVWLGCDEKPGVHHPVVKSQRRQSVVSSSSLVRFVWVESVKKPLDEPLQVECMKDVGDQQLPASPSSSSSSTSVSVESEEESSQLPRTTRKKDMLPVYHIPEHLKHQIDMNKVPKVLRETLSLSNYADFFAVLLYAEDFYIEKWSGFLLYRVNLELDEKRMENARKNDVTGSAHKDQKIYVLFEISSVPERRPYLLSRDFVYVRRSGKKSAHIEGRLLRVIKSTHVLTEFKEDFQAQYSPLHKYDVSFSFNRTCLKRSHQALEAALIHSFQIVLFPNCPPRSTLISPAAPVIPRNQDFDQDQISTIHKIMSLRGPPPYLIKGNLSLTKDKKLSRVGSMVLEAVLQIYRTSPSCRILVSAPKNRTCDTLIASLNKEIPDSELFRANAAFRELSDVDEDVLPLSSYDGECFSEPLLSDLQAFKVIASTFMTSFRLHSRGITAGHFTHIFLVDASSATEPETMVTLANLVGDDTVVVVTGSPRDRPDRVRSDIARRYGLKRSYFHRLLESEPYSSNDPECISSI